MLGGAWEGPAGQLLRTFSGQQHITEIATVRGLALKVQKLDPIRAQKLVGLRKLTHSEETGEDKGECQIIYNEMYKCQVRRAFGSA